jgi:hypothetical protein
VTAARLELVRTGAAAAALLLAVLSRGDVLVLGALLAVVAWRLPALALVPALVAAGWRFGSTSLEALAGAQAVLGPAGLVDPVRGAVASWCAAVAVVLLVPAGVGSMAARMSRPGGPNLARDGDVGARMSRRGAATLAWRPVLVAAATGASAAVVVAGPAPGGDLWVRVVAALTATALATGVGALRASGVRARRVLDVAGVVAAIATVPLLVGEAPGWGGTVDGGALRTGLVLAAAVLAVAVAAPPTLAAARAHRRSSGPDVASPDLS